MDTNVVVAVLGSATTIAALVLTQRSAVKAANSAKASAEQEKRVKVDAEAFTRAKEQYDTALATQERRLANLRAEMEDNRTEYRRDVADCHRQIDHLKTEMDALRRWARTLLVAARAAGVQHPDPPSWLGADTNPGLPRVTPKRED